MDTPDASETRANVLDLISTLGRHRAEHEEQLLVDLMASMEKFNKSMKGLIAEFPFCPSATYAECCDRALQLRRGYDYIRDTERASRNAMLDKLQEHLSVLDKMSQVLAAYGEETELVQVKLKWDLINQNATGFAQQEQIMLQTGLLKIMRGCENEAGRRQFWEDHLAPFGNHVVLDRTVRPICMTSSDATRPESTASIGSYLPQEIMRLIYEAADLETCVSLREVSSAWYTAFQEVDFRAQMKARNPWTEPVDDFNSWTDCVLVFVARLRSWQSAESVDDIDVSAKKEERRTVIGLEIKGDEPLPSNFTGLTDNSGDILTESIKVGGDEHTYVRSQLTLESLEHEVFPVVVAEDHDKTVIKCRDLEVTLPPSIKSQDFLEFEPLTITESFVALYLNTGQVYAVPRDKPHFDHGFYFHGTSEEPREMGGVLVTTETLREWRQTDRRQFWLANLETRQMVDYAAVSQDSSPVASYNGLIWWKKGVPSRQFVVPTFVDLASPDRVYYRADSAITGLTSLQTRQGSVSRNSTQFVLGKTGLISGLHVIDLASGIVTDIVTPRDWQRQNHIEVFAGFVDYNFQARIMGAEEIRDMHHEVLQQMEGQR
jgi:hypothetical protein